MTFQVAGSNVLYLQHWPIWCMLTHHDLFHKHQKNSVESNGWLHQNSWAWYILWYSYLVMSSTDSSILTTGMKKNHQLVYPRLDCSSRDFVWFEDLSIKMELQDQEDHTLCSMLQVNHIWWQVCHLFLFESPECLLLHFIWHQQLCLWLRHQ